MAQARRRCRVAGDEDELHLTFEEEAADLLHEAIDLFLGPGAIGASGGIAEVDDVLIGHGLHDLAGHRKAAEAGVEDADGCVVKWLFSHGYLCTITTSPT